jgi:predicted DNA-binding transcriptional regulator
VLPADADRLALAAVSLASVLELACRIGEIAESNYNLMRQECVRLAEALVDAAARSNDAFDPRILDSGIKDAALPVGTAKPTESRLARDPRPPVDRQSYIGHVKDNNETPKPQVSFKGSLKDLMANIGSSIEDRESKIMDVIRMKGKVSIKDISEAMPDVGEKTVQRALTSLVTRGVLKKEGERRWSRYALAQATLAV